MKNIYEIQGYDEFKENRGESLDLIDGEYIHCLNKGDLLGAGEWLASKFVLLKDEKEIEEVFSKIIAFWASPLELKIHPSCINDLISKYDEFVPEELAISLIATVLRLKKAGHSIPVNRGIWGQTLELTF